MLSQRYIYYIACFFMYFTYAVNALKCRTNQEMQQDGDFEYVVRMCLRRIRNESDFTDSLYKMQSDYNSSRNKRYRDDQSSSYSNSNNNNDGNYHGRNQNKGHSEGFDNYWTSNDNSNNDRNRYSDDRNRPDRDYSEGEPDYYNFNRNPKEGRKKYKSRPHSFQQQIQHDRDMMYNYGNGNNNGNSNNNNNNNNNNRDPSNYFYQNRNKNNKFMFNKDKNNDSPLAEIDPCVIHCIFQEMQMVDENGKPSKNLISQKMTSKIRNSELKNFIQNSVEECFDVLDNNDDNFGSYNSNRHRKPEMVCEWAKTFAMCLEDRGKDNCDDWNDSFRNENSNNNNNNNNNKDEDKHRGGKQNERG